MITLDHKLEPMDPFVPAPLASVNFDSLTWFLNAEGEVFSDEEGLDHNNVDWDSLRTFFMLIRFEFISRIIKPGFRGFKTLPNPKFFQNNLYDSKSFQNEITKHTLRVVTIRSTHNRTVKGLPRLQKNRRKRVRSRQYRQ